MGSATFVVVRDTDWRFEPGHVFGALRGSYTGMTLWQGSDPRQLVANGFADGWEVSINEDLTVFVIEAPPAVAIQLVAWVRAYIPTEVELEVFNDQLTYDPAPLQAGITPAEVGERFFPGVNVGRIAEPPTIQEFMQSGPPPHVVTRMENEQQASDDDPPRAP